MRKIRSDRRMRPITTVGVVLFWPALFFLNGDDADTAELARLRGELIAMEQASRQKNCGITFQSEPATQTASAAPA